MDDYDRCAANRVDNGGAGGLRPGSARRCGQASLRAGAFRFGVVRPGSAPEASLPRAPEAPRGGPVPSSEQNEEDARGMLARGERRPA